MIENSTPDIGRTAIDAYLESVEQALMAAHAPRSDRLQVLQDLESQIVEMLAREPAPLTEESVRSVIDRLEPPRHFANTYGNAADLTGNPAEPTPASTGRFARLPQIGWSVRWPLVAAMSCAMLVLGCVLAMLEAGARSNGPTLVVAMLLMFLGFFLTPLALWRAFRQLQAQVSPRQDSGRELVLRSAVVYCTLAPALLIILVTALTAGVILIPIGIGAIVYAQYLLIRRLSRYMAEALPPQPAAASTRNSNGNGTSSPISSAAPMPAL